MSRRGRPYLGADRVGPLPGRTANTAMPAAPAGTGTTKPNRTCSTDFSANSTTACTPAALRLIQGVSTSSPTRGLTLSFVRCLVRHPMSGRIVACTGSRPCSRRLTAGKARLPRDRRRVRRAFGRISADEKIAVDPAFKLSARSRRLADAKARATHYFEMTSDAFFANATAFLEQHGIDVALIDGLHSYRAGPAQHREHPALPAGRRRHCPARPQPHARLVPVPHRRSPPLVRRTTGEISSSTYAPPKRRESSTSISPRARPRSGPSG
jgi:hypothetical protein